MGSKTSAADICKRHGSQGGKIVTCARCKADIQPYAGVKVAAWRETYVHHPGQCADAAERTETLRKVAQQAMFAWECTITRPGADAPEMCSLAGMGHDSGDTYLEHMKREHGATVLKPTVAPIRLRKGVPHAPRQAPRVAPFKRIEWTERHYAEWQPGTGNERLADTHHRGQFWANGPDANSVIVIEDRRSAGLPNRLVTLYLDGNGQLTADWSEAKSSRREANAAAKRAA